MPVYSSRKPVAVVADDMRYATDHVKYVYDTICYNIINSFSQEDKERYFKLVTEHEDFIQELYGDAMTKSKMFVPAGLRNGSADSLCQQYKIWLEKQ